MTAGFYPPSRGLWIWLRGTWKRLRCHHVPVPDDLGCPLCIRCGAPLL